MRLLVDEHDTDWEITRKTFAYTNYTLMPEALEQWPVELFARILPRHLEIVYEINHRFLEEVRIRYLGDQARVRRLSLICEEGERWVEELEQLAKLELLVEDPSFRSQWRLVKRIHAYKRQHLNLFHILSLYLRLKDNPNLDAPPRTFVFSGKAAPGYAMAKLPKSLSHSENTKPKLRSCWLRQAEWRKRCKEEG